MRRIGLSKFGIASLLLSLFNAVGIFIYNLLITILEMNLYKGIEGYYVMLTVIGLINLGYIFLNVLALGLGIKGILQKKRGRVPAFIGTIISSGILILVISSIFLKLIFRY